jgi:hypothetical protein
MLTAHFFIPGGVPPDSSGLPCIAAFARAHHDAVLISAWLQVTGAILYVGFILAVTTSPARANGSRAGSRCSPPGCL